MHSLALVAALATPLALGANSGAGSSGSRIDASSSAISTGLDASCLGVAAPSFAATYGLCPAVAPALQPMGAAGDATRWSTGPRFGYVVTSDETADLLEQAYGIGPGLSVFGWQIECALPDEGAGYQTVVEVLPLAAGLEHGLKDVSLNVLCGARWRGGFEFLAGYYFSETSFGLTMAVGMTFTVGRMQMPVHVGITDVPGGAKVSLTAGWNL